jgi:PAS domain S-box-containing protein
MNHDMTILAVDDTGTSLFLLNEILSSVGYRVRPADSGELALAAIAAEPPDLILLDVRMPGIGGFEVCRRLKADPRTCDIPVLFLSGLNEQSERLEGLRLGASDFITKPCNRDELIARVGVHTEIVRMRRRITSQVESLQQANQRAQAEIAERRRVEEALRQSEQRFQLAFAASPAAIAITRIADSAILEANAVFCRLVGYSAEEVARRTAASMGLWADPSEREAVLNDLARDGLAPAREIRLHARDGSERNLLWSAARIRIKGDDCMLSMATDITEQKRIRIAFERSQTLLRSTAAMAKMGAWEVDLATGLQTWTEEVYRIHGLPLDHMPTAEEGLSFYAPESRPIITEAFRRVVELGEPYDLELTLINTSGERRLVHALGMAQREGGKVVKVSGTFQDLTEVRAAQEQLATSQHARRRAEEALLAAERNAVVGRLAGRVAHEINNPLASIKAYIEPMRRRVADRPEVDEGLDIINRQVDRVARLVRNLLDFERQRAPNRAPVELPVVLGTVIALLRARADKEFKHLEADIPANLPPCAVDPDQVQQVLINLLENAFDAIDPGHLVQVVACARNDGVVVEVHDDGPGLGQDSERLFTPFVSSKEKGCGLGLPLARRICEAHGGWLRGCNRPAGGASFSFFLPTEAKDPT